MTVGGATETIAANAVTGELFGTVGDGTAELALTLRFGGEEFVLPPLGFGVAIPDLLVTGEGDEEVPLGLDAACDVAQTAALHTAIGCVDVRLGVQIPPDVQWH